MELILKSNNRDKMAKVMALANKLGISVEQKEGVSTNKKPLPPMGKLVAVNELLQTFGKEPNFPKIEEIRSKAWPSSW